MTQENIGNPASKNPDGNAKAALNASEKALWSAPTLSRLEAVETERIVPHGSARSPHPKTPEEMMFLGS